MDDYFRFRFRNKTPMNDHRVETPSIENPINPMDTHQLDILGEGYRAETQGCNFLHCVETQMDNYFRFGGTMIDRCC
jgi:hypothetical protein